MSICVGCLVSAVAASGLFTFGKANEWHAERARRRAMAEIDRTTPCRGRALEGAEQVSAHGSSAPGSSAHGSSAPSGSAPGGSAPSGSAPLGQR